jgi:hypothetical protein
MNDSPLTRLRAAVTKAQAKFDTVSFELRKATEANRTAQGKAADERYERGLELSRGGPRRAPGDTPPPTALETAAAATEQKLQAVRGRHFIAQTALTNAEAALLDVENRIINRHRESLALQFKEAERNGASQNELAAIRAQLRAATPHEMQVRLNQRFTVSSLVREVLDDGDDGTGLRLDVPGPVLRGEVGPDYDQVRAAILAEAERESPPLAAA